MGTLAMNVDVFAFLAAVLLPLISAVVANPLLLALWAITLAVCLLVVVWHFSRHRWPPYRTLPKFNRPAEAKAMTMGQAEAERAMIRPDIRPRADPAGS
jgi:hypothetical protein